VFFVVESGCAVVRMIWSVWRWPTRYIIWASGEVLRCFGRTTSVRRAWNDARLRMRWTDYIVIC